MGLMGYSERIDCPCTKRTSVGRTAGLSVTNARPSTAQAFARRERRSVIGSRSFALAPTPRGHIRQPRKAQLRRLIARPKSTIPEGSAIPTVIHRDHETPIPPSDSVAVLIARNTLMVDVGLRQQW